MERTPSSPINIIYFSAHEDRVFLAKIEQHLTTLSRAGLITTWDDSKISAGVDKKETIKMHLESAHLILMLVSADFLTSEYYTDPAIERYDQPERDKCTCVERAIERHNKREARVIPVLLRPVSLTDTPFLNLTTLPSDGRKVTNWPNQEDAFEDIAQGIRRVVEEWQRLISRPAAVVYPGGNSSNQERTEPPAAEPQHSIDEPPPTMPGAVIPTIQGKEGNAYIPMSQWKDERAISQGNNPLSSPITKGRMKLAYGILPVALIIPLIILVALRGGTITGAQTHALPPIRMWTTLLGEHVGISDGHFSFDTDRLDGADKNQAAQALASGNSAKADSFWQKAIQEDPADAEPLIYQEDQHVLAAGKPYITLVVATILTGDNAHVGRDDLQGAYVAQKEFNDRSSNPWQVRLLIANSGSGDESIAGTVAQQIVQAVQNDKTIVGVMGWPFSESTLHAVKILGAAHIPLVSETASTDQLTGISPYFFRINPPNFQQGQANAQYITQNLHAKRVALFVDPHNAYSSSFANDFKQAYLKADSGNSIVATEQYTVGPQGQAKLSSLLQDALAANPDVIYFAGYANDLSVLLNALPSSEPQAQVPIVGGEGLYEIGGYDHSARAHLGQLHFLAYAYPDEWDIAHLTEQKPLFFQEYINAFNPSGKAASGVYGLTRAGNDVIVAYDATMTMLTASASVLSKQKKGESMTPDQLQQALAQINDHHPFQGVSGRIAFGPDGNPIHKPILLISVNGHVQFQEEKLLSGCLQADSCD